MELGQRLAAGVLGCFQRILRRLGLGDFGPPGGGDLDGHEADAVGHDVMEFPGDAHPFLGDSQLAGAVLLHLDPPGPAQQDRHAEGDQQHGPEVGGVHLPDREALQEEGQPD